MATTFVNLGKHFNSAVDYLTKSKPHVDDSVVQGRRNFKISAINGSANPTYFKKNMDKFLKNNPKAHPNSVNCIKTIISFDPKKLSYANLKDRDLALKIGKRVAKRKYPHCASLIVVQADGKGHKLHDHILTCSRELTTGKSVSHGATFLKTIPYTDEAVKHFHQKQSLTMDNVYHPKHNTSMARQKIRERNNDSKNINKEFSPKYHTYSFIDDLHSRIKASLTFSTSIQKFYRTLKSHNVQLKPAFKMKTNKRTGKHILHFYKHPTKSNIYSKLTKNNIKVMITLDPQVAKDSHIKDHQGEYIRYKRHFTYTFKDNTGKTRTIRDKKIGKDTCPNYINKQFAINQVKTRKWKQEITPSDSGDDGSGDKGAGGATPIYHPTHNVNKPTNQNRHIPKFKAKSKKSHKSSIRDLGITKSKHTFDEYIYGVDTKVNIKGIYEPHIYKAHIPERVMTFHPKSHDLSKAINDLTNALNKIKNATDNTPDQRKQQMEDAYEDSLLRKDQAEKVNEINNENRAIYAKVATDNFNQKRAYYQQQALYLRTLHEAQRERYFHR